MTVPIVDCGTCSDQGPHRRRNEDVALASSAAGVFVVADGLGGAAAGDVAAQVASDILSGVLASGEEPAVLLRRYLPPEPSRDALETDLPNPDEAEPTSRVRLAFSLAHWGVLAEARRNGAIGMGAAAVVAFQAPAGWAIGHVGDCRAYSIGPDCLQRLTDDHSLSRALEGRRSLPAGIASSAFLRSRLTQVVGGECVPSPDVRRWQPSPGGALLLCSDGVWGSLADPEIAAVVRQGGGAEGVTRNLVDAAIAAGSRDNATALLIRFGPA